MAAKENLNLATENGLISADKNGNMSISMKNVTTNAPKITIEAKSTGENC